MASRVFIRFLRSVRLAPTEESANRTSQPHVSTTAFPGEAPTKGIVMPSHFEPDASKLILQRLGSELASSRSNPDNDTTANGSLGSSRPSQVEATTRSSGVQAATICSNLAGSDE